MSTKKISHNINPRATYFKQFKPSPKKIMIWVPPIVEETYFENPESPSIMELVYFIEANGIPRIDTAMYNGSFREFYNFHLEQYNGDETNFCSKYSEGGVNPNYIVNSVDCKYDDDMNVTLVSLNTDEEDNVKDVYALITFRLIENESDTIMVETLCGNRTLPPSGEGTRLINYLTDMAYLVGIHKIALHPIDTAVGYYTRLNFIKLNDDEANAINDEKGTYTMRKNTRARKNWNKLKNAIRFTNLQKKFNELNKKKIIIQTTYKAKFDEETRKRGIPINKPFTQPKQKARKYKSLGKVVGVEMNKRGDVTVSRAVYKVVPGESLKVAKMKSEIEDAFKRSKMAKQSSIKLSPTIEESSPEELTPSQIAKEEQEFQKQEKNRALQVLKEAQTKKMASPIKSQVIEEEWEDEEIPLTKSQINKLEKEYQLEEKNRALQIFEQNRKKTNSLKKMFKNASGTRKHKNKLKK